MTQAGTILKIPVSHLVQGHSLKCEDTLFRTVTRVDYVFDKPGYSSLTEALIYCLNPDGSQHMELFRGEVEIYSGIAG